MKCNEEIEQHPRKTNASFTSVLKFPTQVFMQSTYISQKAKTVGKMTPLENLHTSRSEKTGITCVRNSVIWQGGHLRILVKFTTVEYIREDTAGRTNIGSTRIALICQLRSSSLVIMIAYTTATT